MPTITLAVEEVSRAGLSPTYTASGASPLLNVADTFIFNNTGREQLIFKKTGAGACTVTLSTPNTVDGLAIADRTVTVPAGNITPQEIHIGPLPPAHYNTPGTSLLAGFTLSDITGLSVAIVRLP